MKQPLVTRLSFLIALAVISITSFGIKAVELPAEGYVTVKDIAYRTTTDAYADSMCRLDVAYRPGGAAKPVIIWLHGGGLTGGHRELPAPLMQDSAVIVGVEYRFSPKATIDEIIDDAAAAVAWTMENISAYGGDPNRIFLSGHSAGGYLTFMVGFDKNRLAAYGHDADALAGLIPLSGQCITHFEARRVQGIDALQPTVDALAPLYYVRGDCPPILIISGDREREMLGRYEEQAYLWRMLKLTGHKDVTLYEMDGFDHVTMCHPGFALLRRFVNERSRK